MLKTIIRFSALLLLLTQACSPRHTVQKYSYLTDKLPVPKAVHTAPKNHATSTSLPKVVIIHSQISLHQPPKKTTTKPKTKEVESGLTYSYTPNKKAKKTSGTIAVEAAMDYMGTPYKYGGMNHQGIDCSALMVKAYKKAGINLPRTSVAQSQFGRPIHKSKLQPGDLVFFDSKNRRGKYVNHVGMVCRITAYKTEFIHASSSKGVRVDFLEDPYWKPRFRKAMMPSRVRSRGMNKRKKIKQKNIEMALNP